MAQYRVRVDEAMDKLSKQIEAKGIDRNTIYRVGLHALRNIVDFEVNAPAIKAFAPPPNSIDKVYATPVVDPIAAAVAVIQSDIVETITLAGRRWFDMDAVCAYLEVDVQNFRKCLNVHEDLLDYAGKDWIDGFGVEEAMELSKLLDRIEELQAWFSKLYKKG